MKKIIGLVVFFALCLGAFHFHEGHKSTGYKDSIASLEGKVEHLRSEHNEFKTDIESVNRRLRSTIETLVTALDGLDYQWEEKEGEHIDQLIGKEVEEEDEDEEVGAES